ncbi:GNAT family N-acetyltransferase [Streptomyces sp. AM 2-1-1]|uniref:GNAT family N-acetyltransferase n=1 Tax=unclassified Streptomyces TaxID=2593676 RepID=UPI0023B92F91|nr:GNAT family N-acetyltransferase [Streptomyces sp. AM 2-1-1]WEH43426.1 GNAT family N-acetyltransferase [Streptomyces sp. AM 2-1-1]
MRGGSGGERPALQEHAPSAFPQQGGRVPVEAGEHRTQDAAHRWAPASPAWSSVVPGLRRAVAGDAAEIARLKSVLTGSGALSPERLGPTRTLLAARLGPVGSAVAFVVDAPGGGGLASCALALVHPVFPSPEAPEGLAAQVDVVATEPSHRGRGYATAALGALLRHLEGLGVAEYALYAGGEPVSFYERFGFHRDAALLRMTRVPGRRPAHTAGLSTAQFAETVMRATGFAGLYFTDEDGHPLQLHAVYSSTHPWQVPGGTMDPGERPWGTAVRECLEETGIVVEGPPRRLLAAVYGLPGAQWPYSTFGCIFDGGRLTRRQIDALVLDPAEHDEARVLPLEEWRGLMPAGDYRRLLAVDRARRSGETAYFDTWDWDTG